MSREQELEKQIEVLEGAKKIIEHQEKLIELLEMQIKFLQNQGQIIHYVPHYPNYLNPPWIVTC